MRKLLNNTYLVSGYLSGFSILMITLLIVAQVIGRLFGFIVPSAEDFAVYSLAAATFFGLAYTFHEGGHIRVSLAIKALPPKIRRLQEGAILIFGTLLSAFMAFYMVHLAWESYVFEEVSYGYIPIPLWMPQVPVAIGSIMFAIAIADDLVCMLLGKKPKYLQHEEDELSLDNDLGGEV
ncbi:probable DctQ (C4-dicarboxylate permease, small subunit) [Marinomonas sp. MED121]|uniref:TRAP transporter small permease n=1 Tax=Marinomonas sp. MED121 TaxID=314277 RepID=UPI0000690C21|nr:TRAP transporter small permease [Marinomonas sp. MED121]EAQ64895.1 probable DctQ (C4-dicarboxylate permease, small subunit) [Marinomonas sp. MED121]